MEAVILIGIQASGKTTFYRQHFFDTHVRISLDMLKTRHRQRLLVEACIAAQQSFVLDNTNVLTTERAEVIRAARAAGFRISGYFFEPQVAQALAWNLRREGTAVIPVKGLLGTLKRLERPRIEEGYNRLQRVIVGPTGEFLPEDLPQVV